MIKHEAFFIIFQGLSIAQICLRPESVTLRKKNASPALQKNTLS